ACDGGRLLVDVTRHDAAPGWQSFGHRDGRPAGERADLDDPRRLRHRDEEGEERALDVTDHHLRVLLGFPGLRPEAVEEIGLGARVALGVCLDLVRDVATHQSESPTVSSSARSVSTTRSACSGSITNGGDMTRFGPLARRTTPRSS